ncbi:hypothetical protein ACA910_013442 [Epithemia clementina (nom. ined.)]
MTRLSLEGKMTAMIFCMLASWAVFVLDGVNAFVVLDGTMGSDRAASPPVMVSTAPPKHPQLQQQPIGPFPSSSNNGVFRSKRRRSRLYTVESTRFRAGGTMRSSMPMVNRIPISYQDDYLSKAFYQNRFSFSTNHNNPKEMVRSFWRTRQNRKALLGLRLFAMSLLAAKLITGGGMSSFWKCTQEGIVGYSVLLETNPMVTKSVSAGVIGAIGDFMAQWLEHGGLASKSKKPSNTSTKSTISSAISRYNARRGFAIFADGLLLSGPLMHLGYEVFEHVLPISGGGTLAALAHVVADTVLLDSIFIATTFWMTGLFEGFSIQQILSQFRRDYVATIKAGGLTSFLVMPVELICFRFLPLSFRVLAVNFIDIVWDGVISYMAHRSRGDHNHHVVQHAIPTDETTPSVASVVAAVMEDDSADHNLWTTHVHHHHVPPPAIAAM